MQDATARLASRVQLTTDAHKPDLEAIEGAFGNDVDFAWLVKAYGNPTGTLGRYSPGKCIGADPRPITGRPDPGHISTSYMERQNLNPRRTFDVLPVSRAASARPSRRITK